MYLDNKRFQIRKKSSCVKNFYSLDIQRSIFSGKKSTVKSVQGPQKMGSIYRLSEPR